MTKREALKYFKTAVQLAKVLGITKQAVNGWPMDGEIPELRSMQLKHEIIPFMAKYKCEKVA